MWRRLGDVVNNDELGGWRLQGGTSKSKKLSGDGHCVRLAVTGHEETERRPPLRHRRRNEPRRSTYPSAVQAERAVMGESTGDGVTIERSPLAAG